MLKQYYYFISSLPLLDFHQKAPFSFKEFLVEVERQIGGGDFAVLREATLAYDCLKAEHPALQAWADFNRQLKNEIVRFRSKKFSKDPVDFMRGDHYVPQEISDAVSQATKNANPLEAEKALDLFRWKKLEELSAGHLFDLTALIVYALKLQILDRHQVLSSPQGQALFERYSKVDVFEFVHV